MGNFLVFISVDCQPELSSNRLVTNCNGLFYFVQVTCPNLDGQYFPIILTQERVIAMPQKCAAQEHKTR